MDRRPLLPPLLAPGAGPPTDRMTRLRLMLLALSVSLWAVVIGIRLVQLQVFGRDGLQKLATRQSARTIKLHPRRGPILDRNREPLALSVEHESIYAVPENVADARATVAALSRPLGFDVNDRKNLLNALQSRKGFVWVVRKVDLDTSRAVRDLQLDGIGFQRETRRFYPQRELAAHVIGFVGLDNAGASGIEFAFGETISGREQKVTVSTDARRRPVGHIDRPSTDGHTVVLTIDETIQHAAETELERAMAETSATSGIVIVLDPRTGEILAMTNRPTFNPNKPSSDQWTWANRAVAFTYEPGSMFKVVTAAAALDLKQFDPDEVIDCGGGSIDVAGQRINDHAVFHNLTFREVLYHSSNVGVIRIAQRLGRANFEKYVRDFGFGDRTGVDMPGEHKGLFRLDERSSPVSLASMSFGQEISVTALQMATAMGAIANGGLLMKPLIVRRIEDPSGVVKRELTPVAMRRVIQPSTAETLTDILRGVVREGTGRRAAVPGYVVAGKTGTAQMLDASGHYSMIDHVASFVGFVPASRPALVVLVSLERPRGVRNEGGDVAAPVFSRVAQQALRRLAVPSDDPDRVLRPSADPLPRVTVASIQGPGPAPIPATATSGMPSLLGLPARAASAQAVHHGLMVELQGSGRVVGQTPAPGQPIEPGMTCRLVLDRMGRVEAPSTPAARIAADPRLAQVTP